MNNVKLAVVLAILGIAALGYGGMKFFQGQDVEYILKCLETKEVFTMKLPANTEFPCVNPKTKNKTLYKAEPYYCTATNKNVYMITDQEQIPESMGPGHKEGVPVGAASDKPKAPVVEEPEDK